MGVELDGGTQWVAPLTEDDIATLSDLAYQVAHFVTAANTNKIFAGRALLQAREMFPSDNDFGAWREEVLPGLSRIEATRYMQVAKEYGDKPKIIEALSFRAVRALAAPSTQQKVRDEVEKAVDAGQTFTAAQIEELKRRARKAEEEAETERGKSETILAGQQAKIEAAKESERKRLEAEINGLKRKIKEAEGASAQASADAKAAATAEAQAQAENLIASERAKVADELNRANRKKAQADQDVERLSRQHQHLTERVAELRKFVDETEGAKVEAEEIHSRLKAVQRALMSALTSIQIAEHADQYRDELSNIMDGSAQMCLQMAHALSEFGGGEEAQTPQMRVVSND